MGVGDDQEPGGYSRQRHLVHKIKSSISKNQESVDSSLREALYGRVVIRLADEGVLIWHVWKIDDEVRDTKVMDFWLGRYGIN